MFTTSADFPLAKRAEVGYNVRVCYHQVRIAPKIERNEFYMSASREKKFRQDLAAQGITDPKLIREAEEQAKVRKANRTYGVIAVVFVIVAVALLVYNSGILQRSKTAVTIDGENYTAAQVNYYYMSRKNSILNYATYYGVDTSASMDSQTVSDTAKSMLGIEDEGEMTWDEYLRDDAIRTLAIRVKAAKLAEENGMGADEDIQEEIDATMEQVASYAKQNGYSTKEYLKLVFGSTMTVSTFKQMAELDEVSSHYMQHYQDELTYTDSDLEAYYAANKDTFDVASYEYIYFTGTASSTTDDDGNTVEPTDEENAAAKELAATNAAAALERYQNGESLETIAADYENATYSSQDAGQASSGVVSDWVFDSARQSGDCTVLDNDTAVYVVLFHSYGRQNYNTVDVRHILFQVDTSDLDSASETYEADLQARRDETKAEAEDALAQWQSGEATEDSFAALANELSEDGGSNTNGGLYTEVYKGQMVTEFNDWCFAEGRKAGDAGIVFNEYTGYHVMYFVGEDIPYWKVEVKSALQTNDMNDWLEGLYTESAIEQAGGMKYVG